MGFLGGLILKPVGGDQAGVFDDTNYGKISDNALFEAQHFELEFDFEDNEDNAFYPLFTIGIDSSATTDGHWYLRRKSSNVLAYRNLDEGTTYDLANINRLGFNSISLRKYGTTLKSIVNGGGEVTQSVQDNIPFFSGFVWVGTRVGLVLGDFKLHKVKFWSLDGSGNRVDELINLNWNNGNANTVPNIGADKPASSDMTWVPAGSGTYVDI